MASSSDASSETKRKVCYINDGFPVPPGVTQSQVDFMKSMELFPDDVWVVTYSRSGTTWGQQIVRSILAREDEALRIEDAVPYLEFANSNLVPYNVDVETLKRPRAFKSHMPYQQMPFSMSSNTPGKFIHIVRNPKDVAVSFYFHYFTTKAAENFSWDDYISWFLAGEVFYGDYFDHVLSWWEHRNDENVLFLKYEDMKKDLRTSVAQMASFLGREMSGAEVESVVEKCTFSSMKSNPTTNYEWIPKQFMHPDGTPFIRKGITGGWKEHFSSELSAQFDALYEKKFKTVGLELEFE